MKPFLLFVFFTHTLSVNCFVFRQLRPVRTNPSLPANPGPPMGVVAADWFKHFCVVDDYANYSAYSMNVNTRLYINSGAMFGQTLKENTVAFSSYHCAVKERGNKAMVDLVLSNAKIMQQRKFSSVDEIRRLRLRPRYLRNVSDRDLNGNLLGKYISFPLAISPTAMHKLSHPEGEIGVARAAAAANTIMTLSIYASTSMEEVAREAPEATLWLQMHIFRNRTLNKLFVQRAERAGYRAIVLTIDYAIHGKRLGELRQNFDVPPNVTMANFLTVHGFENQQSLRIFTGVVDPATTWKDVQLLSNITSLPVIAKGILTAEDAELAIQHGAKAILVSNHGGRQLDGVSATIEALPVVVKAVNNRVPVYIDGGIRKGSDIFKALALGAKAAFIGRPAVWGLAARGQEGVSHVLDILKQELDITMALSGCRTVKDIQPDMVRHEKHYRRPYLAYINQI